MDVYDAAATGEFASTHAPPPKRLDEVVTEDTEARWIARSDAVVKEEEVAAGLMKVKEPPQGGGEEDRAKYLNQSERASTSTLWRKLGA